ncbi:unnamed protein product, partial [Discosporangium mesarthrocarpum]
LFVTDGASELLSSKCCFFLRNAKESQSLDTSVAGDQSLLFGEVSGSALAGIEAALSRFLKPLLKQSDGWGKTDNEQKVE